VHLALGHLNPERTTTPETVNRLTNDREERVVGRLPDATWVYPGHGDGTTLAAERPHLGAERPHLEEWRARLAGTRHASCCYLTQGRPRPGGGGDH
jgi:glyoxylase-like metal-dependent hydrolase (beta-lactamase superfamily II)